MAKKTHKQNIKNSKYNDQIVKIRHKHTKKQHKQAQASTRKYKEGKTL